MAFPFTPAKRPYERSLGELNGRGKLQKIKSSIGQQNQLKVASGAIIFRVLCPSSRSGSVIGKGGSIVARIRQETGAKIRLEESTPGCGERVVVITGSEKDAEFGNEQGKKGDEDVETADGGDDTEEGADDDERKEKIDAVADAKLGKMTSSALKALLLVFERIIESEVESDDGDESNNKISSVTIRLLVLTSQVGCLLGKGGSVIKQTSAESGAQIRILPRDKLPLCASPNDDIVQIIGAADSVRKALQSVSQQLLENSPRDCDSFPANFPSGPSSHPFASIPRPEGLPPASYHRPIQGPPFSSRPYDIADYHSSIAPPFSKFHGGAAVVGQPPISPELLTYRLLCSNDKVGSVIGKGGSIIKTLQHETGCEIKILETEPESEDRIVVISGPALPNDRILPVQDAVLRVQHRIVMAVPDNKENMILSRLLVASNQTGCLLGKGGAIIAEMRKLSGAHIRILGKEQIRKDVLENDEVVQITGEFGAVQEALLQITTRLKHHIFRDKLPPGGHHALVEQIPPFGPYMGRRESSTPRLYSNLPSFQKDSVGRPYDERSAFPHAFHGSGFPPSLERGAPWAPQGMRESGGPIRMPDYPGGGLPQRRIGGFAGGSQAAVITNTTVNVVVPRSLVPSIYGEDGGCLRRIREISEAKITITELRPEAKEAVIIISGMPEQAHAAQSLLQAFVLSESGGP